MGDLFGSAVEAVKGGLASLKAKASDLVSSLLQKGANVLVGKRATLGDHLSKVGDFLSGAVSPFKDIVAGLGSTLKGKLSGHVDDLKKHGSTLLQHGKNALGALSEVASDILKQTPTNASGSIDGIAKAAADAGNTVVNHFTGDGSF